MIFYFTGTGNTRWAAQQLAGATGDRLRFIPDELRKSSLHYTLADDERLGICFPTHGWQPPHIVREFLRRASFENVHYVYALTTCGDNMGYAMRILRKELQRHGLTLDAAFAVVMPESNVCFSFLHLDTKESEERKIAAAQERMPHITDLVAQKARNVEELVKGAIPFTFTYVIGGYYNKHLITDEKFWVDAEQCILCGLCARRCPVDDIEGIPPRWKHSGSCTNCLACYHYCPTHAIHWGNMQRGQYYFNKREDQK
jgi:ferredoxin